MEKNIFTANISKKLLGGGLLLALGNHSVQGDLPDHSAKKLLSSQSKQSILAVSKKDPKKITLFVLSPHFDDAALSVGGILSDFEGPKYIVTFFSTPKVISQYLTEWDKLCGFSKSSDSRNARRSENVLACNVLGASIINKNYVDKQYETRLPSDISKIINSISDDIEQLIADKIKESDDNFVVVLGPSYFGKKVTHPDHLLVSKALMRCVNKKSHPNTNFYFYEDLPYTYERFVNKEVSLDKLLVGFHKGLKLSKRELIISEEGFDSKIKGINMYSSQMKAFHTLGDNIVEDIFNFGMNRSSQYPLFAKPCEVIYEVKSK